MSTDMMQAHEERIQKLEDIAMSTNKLLSAHNVTLESIQEKVASGQDEIERKLEKGFGDIHTQLQETNESVKSLSDKVEHTAKRITDIEAVEHARKERTATILKAAMFIFAGIAGALLKQAGEWLWTTVMH